MHASSHLTRPTIGRLRVLETTDLHMQLLDYDYFAGQQDSSIGLIGLADHITALRSDPGVTTLLCDNGDLIQGNPLADELAARPLKTHPMIAALNMLRYDAITLGNHEFDYGLDFLRKTLSTAAFPIVSANIICEGQEPLAAPFAILERDILCDDGQLRPIKIGVTGFAPPHVADWDDQTHNARIRVDDIVETARDIVPHMRAAGADIVFALCHSGIGAAIHTQRMENAALPLSQIDGIDVLLLGHTHEAFPNPEVYGAPHTNYANGSLHNKPAVMATFCGKTLGVIDLDLHWKNTGWQIANHKTRLLHAGAREGDESALRKSLRALVAKPHADTIAKIRAPIARTEVPIASYFATVQPDLSQQLLARAMQKAMQKVLKKTAHPHLPVLAAKSSFCCGGQSGLGHYIDIPQGPITLRDAAAIFPFADHLCAVRRTGKQIRLWLERSAAHYNQMRPGNHNQTLFNPRSAGYNCDTILGLSYQIDLTQPARFDTDGQERNAQTRRIVNMKYENALVQDDDVFIVATNSFRAKGGGGFPAISQGDILHTTHERLRDVLIAYLKNEQTITTPAHPTWRFAHIAQTSATFASAPRARHHLSGDISHIGPRPDGFETYQITF